jgi:hypothetical protein
MLLCKPKVVVVALQIVASTTDPESERYNGPKGVLLPVKSDRYPDMQRQQVIRAERSRQRIRKARYRG